jgi:uncharacterized lipoprotein
MRALAVVLILAGCAPDPGMEKYVRALDTALQAHPETPNAVGEAGADLVIFWDGAK